MMEIVEYIPIEKFNTWEELFKSTSGRYLRNPTIMFNVVVVQYTFNEYDDYTKLAADWERMNTNIVETKRGLWKRLKRKFNILWTKG